MIYFSNNFTLLEDSISNIYLFTLYDGVMTQYCFKNKDNTINEKNIADDILIEYDISIDQDNTIYMIYQNKNYHLMLMIIEDEKTKKILLTEEPMPEIYNLKLKLLDKRPHILYFVLLSGEKKEYRIIHHWFNGVDWITNIVGETKVEKLLNPMSILEYKGELILIYYHKEKSEEIYCKKFNLKEGKWEDEAQLTNNSYSMLYLDSLIIDNKLHLVYCEYNENLRVKYERHGLVVGTMQKELETILSNEGNISWPTLIYSEGNLWVVWAEYESIMSRFSIDKGEAWSSIYQWRESKTKDIVKYKFINGNKMNNNILNYSYGTIQPDIEFIGFGSLKNTTEIPLKKKMKLNQRIL